MNIKELIFESVRQGGLDGYTTYDKHHSHENCEKYCPDMYLCTMPHTLPCDHYLCEKTCFRLPDAKKAAQSGALNKMRELLEIDFADNIAIWCGPEQLSFQMKSLVQDMQQQGSVIICDNCNNISKSPCDSFLSADILVLQDVGEKSGKLESIQFSPNTMKGVIGISFYSERFQVASVSYIPANAEVIYE